MTPAHDPGADRLAPGTILVFARAAEPGRAKTRLARTLGERATHRLPFMASTTLPCASN